MIFKTKNFLITFLIFLAIYQTANLWFENFSSHSFFYLFKNNINMANIQKELNSNIESITISMGNDKYLKQYNNITNTEYKKSFDDAIYNCVKKGKYIYEQNIDINKILKNKSVLYNFSYKINSNDIEKIFGLQDKKFPKNISFDTIALVPNMSNPRDITSIFYNTESNDAHLFKLDKHNLTENIYYTLDNFSNFENKNFYYISTLNSGINLFNKNEFIPKSNNNEILLNNIKVTNPLEQDGGILLSGLEKYIDIFFDNHAIKWNSTIDDTYTYKDDNTVIKYYTNGVLEYVNYKTSFGKEISPYKIATDFLQKDTNIKNEYYLKYYVENDNEITFYFDYKINDFIINLSEEIKEKTNMNSIIEITISENKVSKYKRIVYNFSIDESTKIWNIDFLNVLDKVFFKRSNQNLTNQYVSNIEMVYNLESNKETLSLVWKIDIENNIYYENIEDSGEIWTGN